MKASFTCHAYSRVLSRLSLSPSEVADLLDYDLAVNVGIECGTSRVHRLFFSTPDRMCFVAVQDESTGEVVTILPIDYHETIGWKVSSNAMAEAKKMVFPEAADVALEPVTCSEDIACSTVFRIMTYVQCPDGRVQSLNLGSWPSKPYDGRIASLLEDDIFFMAIEERAISKGWRASDLDHVYVRAGNKGKPVQISLSTRVRENSDESAGERN